MFINMTEFFFSPYAPHKFLHTHTTKNMTNDKKVRHKSHIKSGLAMAFPWDVHIIQLKPVPISFVEQVCPFFYDYVKSIKLERSPN